MTAKSIKHDENIIMGLAFENEEPDGTTNYYAVAKKYANYKAQPLLDEIATKDLRIKKLEYAAKAVIRRGLIHNYMCDDEFEAVIVDLQNVVEGVSGE